MEQANFPQDNYCTQITTDLGGKITVKVRKKTKQMDLANKLLTKKWLEFKSLNLLKQEYNKGKY